VNSCTSAVTTRISSVLPPASFSASAVSVSQIDLAFQINASGHNIVIVYNTTGDFDGTPSGAPPDLGEAYGGGTLIYNGTGASHEHTGLASCTPHYYRAWSYYAAEEMWSTATNATATTATPAAPATLWASATNYTDFTAAWSAAAGAAAYRIDVSESDSFTGAGGESTRTVLASNQASSAGAIAGDWSGTALGGTAYVQMTNSSARIISPAFSTVGFTNLTVDLRSRSFGTVSGTQRTNITISISTNNGADWTVLGIRAPTNNGWQSLPTLTNTANLGHAETRIRWQTLTAADGHGVGVSNLVIQGWSVTESSPAYVPGFENRLVDSGTSVTVTGLLEATTYYFRVRATGNGGCASVHSPRVGHDAQRFAVPADGPGGLGRGPAPAQVDLTWSDVEEEHGYTVWRHTLNQAASATAIGSTAANTTNYATIRRPRRARSTTTGCRPPTASDRAPRARRHRLPAAAAADGRRADGRRLHQRRAITWTAADGATSYRIFRNTANDPGSGVATSACATAAIWTPRRPRPAVLVLGHGARPVRVQSTSDWSTVDMGYRKLATVAGVTASYDVHSDKIALAWTDISARPATASGATPSTIPPPPPALVRWRPTHRSMTTPRPRRAWSTSIGCGARTTPAPALGDFQDNGALGRRVDPDLAIVTTAFPRASPREPPTAAAT
jgi:hypothetical protein